MKKKYEKPVLIIESFQLDATIASNCSSTNYEPLGYTENDCGYGVGIESDFQYFNYFNCDVDLVGSGADANDTICYHGPMATGGITFINS